MPVISHEGKQVAVLHLDNSCFSSGPINPGGQTMNEDIYFKNELDISADQPSNNDLSTNSTLMMSSTRSSGSENDKSVCSLMSLYDDVFDAIYGDAQEVPLSQVANVANELTENCLRLLNKKTSGTNDIENYMTEYKIKIKMLEKNVFELSDRLREQETTSYSNNCLLIKMIFKCSLTPFIDTVLEEIKENTNFLDYMENILCAYLKKQKKRFPVEQNVLQLNLYVLAVIANTCTTTEGCELFYNRLSIILAIVSTIATPEYDIKRISYAALYNLSKCLNIGRINVFENSDLLNVIFKDIQKPNYPEQNDVKLYALKLLKSLTLWTNMTAILYKLLKDFEHIIFQMKNTEGLMSAIFENYMRAKEIYDALDIV